MNIDGDSLNSENDGDLNYLRSLPIPDEDQDGPEYDPNFDQEPQRCHYCGKELENFDDTGCEHCDSRHPGFGLR